jgi:hypothetical protein
MASTITVQNTLDFVRTYPSLTTALGNPAAGYGGNAVALRIANKVIQEIIQENMPWKWNRVKAPAFYLNQLQQDYSTSITNLAWIEDCVRVETDDPEFPFPSPPNYPIRGVEAVRDLLPTSVQGIPTQICWLPNSEAICGQWSAHAVYVNPAPLDELPVQNLTQIKDPNGNIQVLTTFGTTGTTQPTWNTVVGGTTTDGSCVWTMQDPNGITFRLSPVPPNAGIVYLIQPFYQAKPTIFTNVNQVWTIPDELSSLYAYAYDVSENEAAAEKEWGLFQQKIKKAISSSTREQESYGAYPGRSLTGQTGSSVRGDEQYPPGLFYN